MSIEEIEEQEYYIVDCEDFIYFPRIVHIIGCSGGAYDEIIRFIIDIPDPIYSEKHRDHDATPSFLNYNGFPASICTSINEEVVHGIPSNRKRAKDWNTKGKYMCAMNGHLPKGYYL